MSIILVVPAGYNVSQYIAEVVGWIANYNVKALIPIGITTLKAKDGLQIQETKKERGCAP